jgi:hypothetical protein
MAGFEKSQGTSIFFICRKLCFKSKKVPAICCLIAVREKYDLCQLFFDHAARQY